MVTEFYCNLNCQRSSSIMGMTTDMKRRNQTWWPFRFTACLKSFTSPICNQILVDLSQTGNEIHLKFCSAKDDLCVLELMNKSVLCSYLNFQELPVPVFKNISGSVLSKNKKNRKSKKLWILVISKTSKEPVGFMKEPATGQLFDFFNSFENCNYMPELGL